MGARGPAPTPTETLRRRGSWRAKLREGEVQYEPGRPKCPPTLGKTARREWGRQVRQLEAAGVLCLVDRAMLAAYCEAWGEFSDLRFAIDAMVKREGMEDGYTAAIAAGLVSAKNKASDRMQRLAQQFGFSPAARTRVKGGDVTEDSEDGKAKFFAG